LATDIILTGNVGKAGTVIPTDDATKYSTEAQLLAERNARITADDALET
jgi:hypothetical protein